MAGSVGTPHATWTCPYMNAAIIENAPWAKLKTPDVGEVTTRPEAVIA